MADLGLASIATERWLLAAVLLALWTGLSLFWLRGRKAAAGARVLIIHASQTGHGAEFAAATYRRIIGSDASAELVDMAHLTAEMLAEAQKLFFIVSTTGHGEAPDPARNFERKIMSSPASLGHAKHAIMALGDRQYADYCAFGCRLEKWLTESNAPAISPMVKVDDLAPDDLAQWDSLLTDCGYPAGDASTQPALETWSMIERELVANGDADREQSSHGTGHGASRSDGLYRIRLRQEGKGIAKWQIGDLFELTTPDGHKRDYSIANRSANGEMELFVRRVALAGGGTGVGSGLLTGADVMQPEIVGRIRSYPQFGPTIGTGPLLAIAAGSGWAGVRSHVIQAYEDGRDVWLIFGDRGPDETEPLLAEMQRWKRAENLTRLDLALSRLPNGNGRYVQAVIVSEQADITRFLSGAGASAGSVVLCGGQAMGEGVIAALGECMGADWIEQARVDNRWRQELY